MVITKKTSTIVTLIFTISISCNDEIPVINESDTYVECNSRLVACTGSKVGEYCLFGYKWGLNQEFDETGIHAEGPRTPGGVITYSFQGRGHYINTHRQVNVPSQSWCEILDGAQGQIRRAISEWEAVANISFQELPDDSESDVELYVAALLQSAVAFPNYTEAPCDFINGDIIFDANSKEKSCDGFYKNALHEIGHVLGLGHVNSKNIMVPDGSKFALDGLQSGDIEGVKQIYGPK